MVKLPELPKINKHKEADAGLLLRKWLKGNPLSTCSLEVKQTGSDSIPFSAVEETQVNYGSAIRHNKEGVLIRVQGINGEPDYIYMRNEPSYIVEKFKKSVEIISVDVWILEAKKSPRKSLTYSRAKDLSTYSIAYSK